MLQLEGQPLVLVLDIDAPDSRLEHFLPGVAARHAVYQQLIERVVAEQESTSVRLFRISEVTAALGPDAFADGMYFAGGVDARGPAFRCAMESDGPQQIAAIERCCAHAQHDLSGLRFRERNLAHLECGILAVVLYPIGSHAA
jgi:hypothetical protein